MIYQTPYLEEADLAVLDLIERQRDKLKIYTLHSPKRWFGTLRRTTLARAIQGSNSIEGYHATLDDVMAVVENELTDERTETSLAILGYRNALTYIAQAATDPFFEFSKQFLKSLHFMMIGHDMSKYPGQWRPGPVFVVNEATRKQVYEAPDADFVNALIDELVVYLKTEQAQPGLIKGAMAHLNLVMIHPFKDGNGRMARALQTLVIAMDGMLHPVFSSIEEWLGRNTEDYYAVLARTGEGRWNPQRSALDWVRFCLKAHYQQAATLIRRNEEYATLADRLTQSLEQDGMSSRALMPVFDAALGLSITNPRYRQEAEVTDLTASRDLKKLTELGFLAPFGEGRGRVYRASDRLKAIRMQSRQTPTRVDPYDIIMQRRRDEEAMQEPKLPGF